MSEQTQSAQQQRHYQQNARANELKDRVLALLAGEGDKTNAAIAARFLIGGFKLLKASSDTLLILAKANGEDVRLPMLLDMSAGIVGQEGVKTVSPIYLENLQPFIDRLLNAAAECLDAETPAESGAEDHDLDVLGTYMRHGKDISSRTVGYIMTNHDLDAKVRADSALAGFLAADLNDIADQADSIGYKLPGGGGLADLMEVMAEALMGGEEGNPGDELSEALKGVDGGLLLGAVYHNYLSVILPFLADLNTLIDNTVPAEVLANTVPEADEDAAFAELLGGPDGLGDPENLREALERMRQDAESEGTLALLEQLENAGDGEKPADADATPAPADETPADAAKEEPKQ